MERENIVLKIEQSNDVRISTDSIINIPIIEREFAPHFDAADENFGVSANFKKKFVLLISHQSKSYHLTGYKIKSMGVYFSKLTSSYLILNKSDDSLYQLNQNMKLMRLPLKFKKAIFPSF